MCIMYILSGKTIHLEAVMKHFYRKHKKLCLCSLAGILFVSSAGCLMHFVYEWSGQNFVLGLFAPVSESTWEHMKLAYFPMLLFFLVEYIFLYKSYPRMGRIRLRTGRKESMCMAECIRRSKRNEGS